jgi:hypothetical protein
LEEFRESKEFMELREFVESRESIELRELIELGETGSKWSYRIEQRGICYGENWTF